MLLDNARFLAVDNAGSSRPARRAMRAMTTTNSMSVNAPGRYSGSFLFQPIAAGDKFAGDFSSESRFMRRNIFAGKCSSHVRGGLPASYGRVIIVAGR
jgi:hypothetical protein